MRNALRKAASAHKALVFLVVYLLIRILLSALLPLTGDEAYFVEWARHLDWCYYDHPGMVAWLMYPTVALFGPSLLAIRFQAVLAGLVVSAAAYALTSDMTGDRDKALLSMILAGCIPMAIGSVLVSTDTPLLIGWSLAMVFLYRAILNNRILNWVLAGVFLGIAFLSKFLAFGFIPALAAFLLLSPNHRYLLKSRGLWLMLGLAVIMFIPVVLWNSSHNWLTFKFNFMRRQGTHSFAAHSFLGGQLLFFSPVVAAFYYWHVCKENVRILQDSKNLFLVLFAGSPLFGFLLVSFFREVGGHWTSMALVPLAVFFVLHSAARPKLFSAGVWTAWGFSAAGILLVFSLIAAGPDRFQALTEKIGKPEDVAERLTGEVFAEKNIAVIADLLRKQNGGFPATRSYSLSSMLTHYDPGNEHYYLWGCESFYGRNFDLWDSFAPLKGQTMNLVEFKSRLDAQKIAEITPFFTSLTIHFFNEPDVNGWLRRIEAKGAAALSHDAPRATEAFVIIEGVGFNGQELMYELD